MIDTVLMPPALMSPSGPSKDIVQLAVDTNTLSTLVTALKAGDLVGALQGKGPFTVFAPSNAAFAKLPKATLASLLNPTNKGKLVDILTYHVVSGAAVYSKDLKPTQSVKTLQGQNVLVKKSSDGVTINGNSKVIAADIAATNGVVHMIDTVLMPPAPTITPTTSRPNQGLGCPNWCRSHPADWNRKCRWRTTCARCSQCSATTANGVCKNWCAAKSATWEDKCTWKNYCGGCPQCSAAQQQRAAVYPNRTLTTRARLRTDEPRADSVTRCSLLFHVFVTTVVGWLLT